MIITEAELEVKRIVDIFKDLGVSGKYSIRTSFQGRNHWWGKIAGCIVSIYCNSTLIKITVNRSGNHDNTYYYPSIYSAKFNVDKFTEKHAEDVLLKIFEIVMQ